MKLLVFDAIYIPGYGMGPFITPIEITDPVLLAEVRQKSRVKVIEDRKPSVKKNNNNTYPIPVGQFLDEEVIVETTETEEVATHEIIAEEEIPVDNKEEEVTMEEVQELKVEEEPVVEEPVADKVLLTEEDLKDETVAELKARLDEMGVDYLYKDSKNVLIGKILENQ